MEHWREKCDGGAYFAWGETTSKTSYTSDNYKHSTDAYNFIKYNGNDGLTTLYAEDDAATANWGEKWRMPTKEEFQELIDNCTWTYHKNGWSGYIVTSKTNGNQIILRAGGVMLDEDICDWDMCGTYFSSSRYDDNGYGWEAAYTLLFCSGEKEIRDHERSNGQTIRPVLVTK